MAMTSGSFVRDWISPINEGEFCNLEVMLAIAEDAAAAFVFALLEALGEIALADA